MERVLTAQQIKQKSKSCPVCDKLLVLNECELAVYEKIPNKSRRVADYIVLNLPYCSGCKLHYVNADILTALHSLTEYKPYIKTYMEYNNLPKKDKDITHKKKRAKAGISQKRPEGTIPYIISSLLLCPEDPSHVMSSSIYRVDVYLPETSQTQHGYIDVLAPYCSKCKKHFFSAEDIFKVNDFHLRYTTLPNQPRIGTNHIIALVKKRLKHQTKIVHKKMTSTDIDALQTSTSQSPYEKDLLLSDYNEHDDTIRTNENTQENDSFISPELDSYTLFNHFIGEKIQLNTKNAYYGDGHGTVTDFDGYFLSVIFESTGFATKFSVEPQFIKNYNFNDPELENLLEKIAESNLRKKQEQLSKKKTKLEGTLRCVDWTHGREPYPIYVCRGAVRCRRRDAHELESVTANVALMHSSGFVPINVMYCAECNKYFIRDTSYNNYKERYGPFVVKLIYKYSVDYDGGDFYSNLNPQSELASYGYKADAKSTDIERQQALVSIIEHGLMNKGDIINHLENLLVLMENNYYHYEANIKRQRDLEFLNNYNIERQREIFGMIIKRAEQYRRDFL